MMTEFPKATFFMVYGGCCGTPTAQHDTYEDAAVEAKRLARANPGQCFVVLEAIRAFRIHDVDAVTLSMRPRNNPQDYDDGIPF